MNRPSETSHTYYANTKFKIISKLLEEKKNKIYKKMKMKRTTININGEAMKKK